MSSENEAVLLQRVEQFLYREARLADTHAYEAWEALWADDGVYWIPANGDDIDPEVKMSIIYDNRSRIALRVRQLLTGRRLAQTPASRLCRSVSNVELLSESDGQLVVASNVLIFESHVRGDQIWSSRNTHTLRPEGDDFRIVRKKVVLTNNDKPLTSMAFLV